MVFSSIVFLFLYLPLVLAVYYVALAPQLTGQAAPRSLGLANGVLLIFSLIFYFWGENFLVWIVIASSSIDYICGLMISGGFQNNPPQLVDVGSRRSRLQQFGLALSIVSNLLFLGYFKYSNFAVDSAITAFQTLGVGSTWERATTVALPLGISFYTFQSMSYTIDVYRGHVRATRNFLDFACYVTLFPQLVAGPIVRYRDLADQLRQRSVGVSTFARGVERFIIGLGKKVIVANTVAIASDKIFALSLTDLTFGLAWLAVTCYTIQIYFDFSGYSDMAIGLGLMFGFAIPENFNYPYSAHNVQDFWRRWHISLSTWFRDYLYIPLGGSRISGPRTYLNLVAVFLLCGLWHGASWTFVVWGLYHGFFLVMERLGSSNTILSRMPASMGRVYTLLVVMGGWVLFRSETFSQAAAFFAAMTVGGVGSGTVHNVASFMEWDLVIALLIGIAFSTPSAKTLIAGCVAATASNTRGTTRTAVGMNPIVRIATLLVILAFCVSALASGTHNPFIYFRF